MWNRVSVCVLASLFNFPIIFTAHAATRTASMSVGATVADVCSVTAGMFPSASDRAIRSDASAVTVNCLRGTPYTVSVDADADADVATILSSAGSTVTYATHGDTGRTGASNGTRSEPVPTSGRRLASQALASGTYGDVLIATITY